ncbi:MAG: DUF4249 domain-containing protein [Cyclobacteriaceae bacterium]
MKSQIIFTTSILILLVSCTEPIIWEVDPNDTKIVVEGRITTELKQHEILLTKTADYFSNALPEGVSNADVSIGDGTNTFDLTESESQKGLYLTNEMAGEIGKTYTLTIELNSAIGGESHFKASSYLSKVIPIDSIDIRQDTVIGFGTEDIFWVISFSGQEVQGEESFYQADVLSNGSSIIYTVIDYITWDDFLIEDEYFEELDIWSGGELMSGDTVTLIMYSIEEQYIDFIDALATELEGPDELGFSGPPANAVGNISNNGLGYFIASDVSHKIAIVPKLTD